MSVLYRIFLAVLISSISAQSAAQAETKRHYRVELIVVRHLAGSSDSTPRQQLRDLTGVLDLYGPPDPAASEPQPEPAATADPGDPATAAGLEPEKPAAIPVDEMSDTMREAWRRLRGSAGFRPELFRAWEQSGDQPFPTLRIHDDEVLFEIEPDALLAGLPKDEHGARVFSDQNLQRQQDSAELRLKDSPDDNNAAVEAPPTQYYYRVDGTGRLTRSRFLHLDLNIELREPLYGLLPPDPDPDSGNNGTMEAAIDAGNSPRDAAAIASAPPQGAADGQKTGPAADATAFRIHQIEQRRQVKTEQMEYFDGPVIGILALVTGFDVIAEDHAMETDAPAE